jgi:hypothetical protein
MGAPHIVAAEPRYRADVFDEMWNLDGLPWVDAPPPPRAGHRHVAQTVGYLGLDEIWRCPCGAISRRGEFGWLYVSPRDRRFAVEPDPVGWVHRYPITTAVLIALAFALIFLVVTW